MPSHSDSPDDVRQYLALIPARGGSRRIPRKNLVPFDGQPLLVHTVRAARNADKIGRVIVSTEDQEIADVARSCGAEVPFLRPQDMAQDESPVMETISHALNFIENEGFHADAVVLLQPTSPFRTSTHIDEAIAVFESTDADTVTAVRPGLEHPYYAWRIESGHLVPFFTIEHQKMVRQELPPVYVENGSIYIIRRQVLETGRIYGKRIAPYVMDHDSSLDIDAPSDLQWAEYLLARRREQE